MHNYYNIEDIILKDINKNGKDNKWKERHLEKNNLAESYKRIGSNKYYRVLDCGTLLDFGLTINSSLRLLNANFCKVRLCPMCSWRRSLKIFGQVSKVMDYVEKNYDYKYIFLTLTVKNVYKDELKNTLDLMTKSFNKMNQRKDFKKSIKGYFRSLEINYDSSEFITIDMYYGNAKKHIKSRKEYYDKIGLKVGDKNPNFNKYHPHFHLILAVNKSYFCDKTYYLSQEKWTELWKSCLGIDYFPVVNVKKIKENNDKNLKKAVAETAKYSVKPDDFLITDDDENIKENMTDEVVKTLDQALHRKRLTSFGFIFKEVHRKLNLDDVEDGNLGLTDNDDLRKDLTNTILRYQWNIGIKNYKLIEVIEDKVEKEGNKNE